MSEKKITAWTTKYWESLGIQQIEAVVCKNVDNAMIKATDQSHGYYHGEGREWHRTEEAAKLRVKELAKKKLISIAKKRAKILEILKTVSN